MYKVMIVDDMDIIRRELKRLKFWGEASGFVISQEANNGQEALNLLANNPVDLIITDIKMPKINGLELLGAIVEKNLCSCVVLLSDFSEFSYARQGIILGAFDYIPKPINEMELCSLLQRAKEYLDQKQKEKDRIRKLEESHLEKVVYHIPMTEILRQVELIQAGDDKVLAIIEQLLDQTRINTDNDINKISNILKNWIQLLVLELLKSNPWSEKFIDTEEWHKTDFIQYKEFTDIKGAFIEIVKEMINLFQYLKCNIQDKGVVKQVCSYILKNVDSDISLTGVAGSLFMNKTYISEVFKQKTGMSFTDYVTRVKMARAKILILRENWRTYEIADKLSYKDVEYFSKVFKKITGFTPTEFRQKNDKN